MGIDPYARLRTRLFTAIGLAYGAAVACGEVDTSDMADGSDASVAGTGGSGGTGGTPGHAATGGTATIAGGTGGTGASDIGATGGGGTQSGGGEDASGDGDHDADSGLGGACSGVDPARYGLGGDTGMNQARVACYSWEVMRSWPANGSCDNDPLTDASAAEAGPEAGAAGAPPHMCRDSSDVPTSCSITTCETVVTASQMQPDGCCYCIISNDGCLGRPCLVGGSQRIAEVSRREDWRDAAIARVPESRSMDTPGQKSAQSWRNDALMEHASVAAFAQLTLLLLAQGAPPELIAEAQRAGLDEIEHARACFALAERCDGQTWGPGALRLDGMTLSASLAELAVTTARDGCVEETIAALVAHEQGERASDPLTRSVLRRIAEDESRHAELAWKIVRWAIEVGGPPVREAVRDVFVRARETRHPARNEPVRSAALDRVINPCADALLA